MKKPTYLLLISLVLAGPSSISSAKGDSPADSKQAANTTIPQDASASPKPAIASQPEPSEKEMLIAINAKLERLEQRITNLEIDQRSQLTSLREGVQQAFTQVGDEIGSIQNSIVLLKKAAKAATTPPAEKPRQP